MAAAQNKPKTDSIKQPVGKSKLFVKSGVKVIALTSLLVNNKIGETMHIDEILKVADFSKETNFKERLYNKLIMIFSDGEIDDDEAASVFAARGIIMPFNYREEKDN